MNSNILSNNFYELPTNGGDVSPSSAEGLETYMEEVKDFFINKLKFFQYGEKETIEEQNIYYFSDKENGTPFFCFYNAPAKNTGYYNLYVISPCTFDGLKYRPLKYPLETDNTNFYYGSIGVRSDYPESITYYLGIMRWDYSNYTFKKIVQDIKFIDGRRVIFFKDYLKNTQQLINPENSCALFFTDIRFKNNLVKDWIFLTKAFNTSYNIEFQQHLSNINISNSQAIRLLNIDSIEGTSGIIPSYGKEYLIKQNFYIGDEAYIPNIYRYSNKIGIETNNGIMGQTVTINNNDFLILYNDYERYDPYQGVGTSTGFINSGRTFNMKINTESLLIPI